MASSKNFPATARKLRKAREDGDVAKSKELTSSGVILISFLVLVFSFDLQGLINFLESCFQANSSSFELRISNYSYFGFILLARICFPFLISALIASFCFEAVQVGIYFSFKNILPNFSRFNLQEGFKKIFGFGFFSQESSLPVGLFYEVLKSLLLGIMFFVTSLILIIVVIKSGMAIGIGDFSASLDLALRIIALTFMLAFLSLFLVGITDYFIAYMRRKSRLKMDIDELKQELRETQGNPELKWRRKQLQQEIQATRLLHDIRKAKVVITNSIE